MKGRKTKLLSILLVAVMVIGLFPMTLTTKTLAAGSNKAIMLGTGQLLGGQASSVYYGTYPQRTAGATKPTTGTEGVDWMKSNAATQNGQGPYYYIDPVKWRVLEKANGNLLLLSDKNLDVQPWHEDDNSTTWAQSTIRSWLNGYDSTKHTGSSGTDYSASGASFIGTAFSERERSEIITASVINETADNGTGNPNPSYFVYGGPNTFDKVFLLSASQINNEDYFADTASLIAVNTSYVYGGGQVGSNQISFPADSGNSWWLRTRGGSIYNAALITYHGGRSYYGNYVTNTNNGVRPAFELTLNNVLFTTAAVDGKVSAPLGAGALTAVNAYTGSDWKLTMKDNNRHFAVVQGSAKATPGEIVRLDYSGAATGTNEYISAMIVGTDNEVLYYGRVAPAYSPSGNVSVTVPTDLAVGSYTLKLFSEQYNGDKKTDYASAFVDVELTVSATPTQYPITVTGGKATVSGVPVTTAAPGTTVTLTAYTPADGMDFEKWEILSGSVTFDPNEWQPEVTFVMPSSAVSVKSVYVKAPDPITAVAVTVTAPVAGQSAIFDFTVVSGENYFKFDRSSDNSGQYCCWAVFDTEPSATYYNDADWKLNSESITFEAGKYYAFRGYLRTSTDYYFSYDATATVNNQKADYTVLSAMNADIYFLFYCAEPIPETYTLTFDTNGGTAVAPVTKAAGTVVDLSGYTTDKAGFLFDGWFSDAALQNKVTSVTLTGNTTVYAGWKKTDGNPFVDVKPSDWFYDDVLWAVQNGITAGTSPTTFSPLANCTRSQTVTFLYCAAGSPEVTETNPFKDVKEGDWFYDAVLWAVQNGITAGTSPTTFSPLANCTRSQTVTFLYCAAGSPEVTGTNPFKDVKEGDWFYDAVLWAVQNGITAGTSPTTFSPLENCTRSQIVAFLHRQLES